MPYLLATAENWPYAACARACKAGKALLAGRHRLVGRADGRVVGLHGFGQGIARSVGAIAVDRPHCTNHDDQRDDHGSKLDHELAVVLNAIEKCSAAAVGVDSQRPVLSNGKRRRAGARSGFQNVDVLLRAWQCQGARLAGAGSRMLRDQTPSSSLAAWPERINSTQPRRAPVVTPWGWRPEMASSTA